MRLHEKTALNCQNTPDLDESIFDRPRLPGLKADGLFRVQDSLPVAQVAQEIQQKLLKSDDHDFSFGSQPSHIIGLAG
jgi:hypothetical protein